MTETKFSEDSINAMTHRPSNRRGEVAKVIRAFGGEMHDFYWVFGDVDAVFIFDAPDAKSAMSILLSLSSAGAVTTHKTTALLSNEEAMEAMSLAGSRETGYRTPREEWKGWQDEGGEG
ncbi:MAG: GYD domain-containing protein [Rhodospirillales bacterium]|nr:GYD domain-containing protein [Rhodospirillales bacterium]